MVYEWAHHKDVCYKLYIEERKSLEDIMQHMREHYNFQPSKRAFQQQFRRWQFPSKQNPAHRNADLVNRVRELWEANYTQAEMLKSLNDEGFDIKERELMRLRAKHRLLLRIPNGMKQQASAAEDTSGFQSELLEPASDHVQTPVQPTFPTEDGKSPEEAKSTGDLSEILRKRKERQDERQAESDARWATKKRRRRTKDYAGLAADPPGPPRFPSETTLDESKVFLALDTKQYRDMRDQFQAICEDEGVIKKTLAGTDKWAAVKDRLVRENEELQAVLWHDKENLESKQLALDVICTDVTKRMRTQGTRMTIIQAKKFLGINPEESRQVRNAFYNILQADEFTSKIETGPERWKELKDQWVSESPILQQVLGTEESNPDYEAKYKALEVLCRDVMKRLRDDQAKEKEGGVQKQTPITPSTSAQAGAVQTAAAATNMAALQQQGQSGASTGYQFAASDLSDLPIDPGLLEAAASSAISTPAVTNKPTAIYIRPHAMSELHSNEKISLASLSTKTVEELHRVLQRRWPSAAIARVDGVEKGTAGEDISYLIEEDDELEAYLDHVKGRKATFVVQLALA